MCACVRLKRGLDNRISAQFANMQMAAVDAGESKVFATLGAATNLLVDLEAVDSEVKDIDVAVLRILTRRCALRPPKVFAN